MTPRPLFHRKRGRCDGVEAGSRDQVQLGHDVPRGVRGHGHVEPGPADVQVEPVKISTASGDPR